jgi:hypothetical protein
MARRCGVEWRLVTNSSFNPSDQQRWNDEIIPLFKALGLHASYWEKRNIDALLAKHPEVYNSFIDGETRAFLTLAEIPDSIKSTHELVGRESEIQHIKQFLESNELFIVVHGAGGIGKTHLVVEAGERISEEGIWQVFWANVNSMSSFGAWHKAIIPERPTLLIIDDPEDKNLLQIMAEQLSEKIGRTSQWKVAITVRSYNDPVLNFLRSPKSNIRGRVQELPLLALATNDAEDMCHALLSAKILDQTEDWLALTIFPLPQPKYIHVKLNLPRCCRLASETAALQA